MSVLTPKVLFNADKLDGRKNRKSTKGVEEDNKENDKVSIKRQNVDILNSFPSKQKRVDEIKPDSQAVEKSDAIKRPELTEQTTCKMVVAAIKSLNEISGSTPSSIKNYISQNYKIDLSTDIDNKSANKQNVGTLINNILKNGVKKQVLEEKSRLY